jgi:hypothetical protein
MLVIPLLGRWRREDCEFEASVGYSESLCPCQQSLPFLPPPKKKNYGHWPGAGQTVFLHLLLELWPWMCLLPIPGSQPSSCCQDPEGGSCPHAYPVDTEWTLTAPGGLPPTHRWSLASPKHFPCFCNPCTVPVGAKHCSKLFTNINSLKPLNNRDFCSSHLREEETGTKRQIN